MASSEGFTKEAMANMSVEQLTEQMAKAMEDAEANQPAGGPTTGPDATKPRLPPGHALHSNKTVDEVVADLNKSPLFMTELEENDDIAALQALAYEGTPLENGFEFKERGNECFREKHFADAREFYTKGLQCIVPEMAKRAKGEVTTDEDGNPDSEDVINEQKNVAEGLYINRAACELELRNYRSCWTDCASALRLNPKNVKACYRSAKALLTVGRIEEADDVCSRGLTVDPENKSLLTMADLIIKKAKERDTRRKMDDERDAKQRRRGYLRKAALKARNIATRTTNDPPDMEDACVQLEPDQDDPRSSLAFPTMLLYPLHMETDFIKSFNEQQTLADHLDYVFPLPWDTEKHYTMAGTECYVETKEGGLLKMGKKVPLLKILTTGKVEVVDDLVNIFVLPKAGAETWVKEFKEKRAATRGAR